MQFRRLKIKDYGIMDKSDTEAVTAHLKKGGIMVGTFPISRNYYSLSPRDVYVYDPDKVIKHEKSGLTATHVAMMIGIGRRLTESKRFSRHMVMQNSEGKLFGINGIGRVGKKQTLRKLYWIEVEDVKPKPAPSTSGRRERAREVCDAKCEASSDQ
jgi:senataxin